MTIRYASNLHLEFPENEFYIKNDPLKPGADILLLGGDRTIQRAANHHRNIADFEIGRTIMLTNQLRYVQHRENALFSTNKTINTGSYISNFRSY